MSCENCGKNYANVRYTQIINGVKKEISVCEECSRKLGIDHLNFDMAIDFSSYLGEFFGGFNNTEILPIIKEEKQLKCSNCETTFEEFIHNGKFGCQECYNAFKEKIDTLLKEIHGANRHVGRLGKIKENIKINTEDKIGTKQDNKMENETKEGDKITKLKKELKQAINEERYEEAARLRDEIREIEEK